LTKIKNIKIKNFLSIGNALTEFDLSSHSHTLIVGNSGEGKSTLIDAISFALYGTPYRKIKKGQIVNSINKKNLLVEIEFDNYKVIRGISPNKFEIYKDDVLIEQSSDVKSYQEFLEKEVLKMNHKTFIQTVILGSAAFTPFMQLTPADRRKVIEDILDIHVFSKMSVLAKIEFDSLKKTREDLNYKISVIKESISSFSEIFEKQKASSEDELNEINDILKRKKEEHENIQKIITDKNLTLLVREEEKLAFNYTLSEISEATQIYYDKWKALENEIKFLRKDLAFISDNGSCSLCKQDITLDHKHKTEEEINTKIKSLSSKMETYENKYSTLNKKKNDLVSFNEELSSLNTSLLIEQNKLSSIEDSIRDTLARKKSLKNKQKSEDYNITKNKLVSLKEEIGEYNRELQDIVEQQKNIKTCIDILKDDGIKTVVISKYIPVLNKYINKYLEELDMFVSFELDSEFNETIKSRFRDDFSYFSFSEGEKKRIDLSILLAFRDITKLKNSAYTNLLIVDELMDGLDTTNVDNVEKIISSFEDTSVIIISHNDDIKNRDIFKRVIKAKKVNNFTEYEDI
jgi:DNA repair exonuclease SbcCD ATPase subunit